MEHYGLHLSMRLGAVADRAALDDTAVVHSFLRELPGRVRMQVLAGPLVEREEGESDKAGVSGIVLLRESHAAIHTYPALAEAFLDLFSCRHFEVAEVAAVFEEFFGSHRVRETVTRDRGRHWETGPTAELAGWVATR
jgi:S-adenosylmethionine decarboxylase